jgi:hypothetical protein
MHWAQFVLEQLFIQKHHARGKSLCLLLEECLLHIFEVHLHAALTISPYHQEDHHHMEDEGAQPMIYISAELFIHNFIKFLLLSFQNDRVISLLFGGLLLRPQIYQII